MPKKPTEKVKCEFCKKSTDKDKSYDIRMLDGHHTACEKCAAPFLAILGHMGVEPEHG